MNEIKTTTQHDAQLNTAVLFLVFNRPDVTAQVFKAIRAARPTRLYVAADGPRTSHPDEKDKCAEVRKIATEVDWPCDVKTLFRNENLGCKIAVSSGISWFFDHEPEGIILEDDCLPNQSFFWFCQQLLEKYRDDHRIGMIAGTRMAEATFERHAAYSFSRLIQIWGWAGWRRTWKGYDAEMKKWPLFKEMGGFEKLGIRKDISRYLEKNYEKTYRGMINTWDYQWSFKCVSEGRLTIFPKSNLIVNIGFGSDATHTTNLDVSPNSLKSQEEITEELRHPLFVLPNLEYDKKKIKRRSFISWIYKEFNFFVCHLRISRTSSREH